MLVTPPVGYEFDCVSELWFDDIEAATRFMGDSRYRNGIAADLTTFCDIDSLVTMVTQVTYSWSPVP